jgi:hypothetical protein
VGNKVRVGVALINLVGLGVGVVCGNGVVVKGRRVAGLVLSPENGVWEGDKSRVRVTGVADTCLISRLLLIPAQPINKSNDTHTSTITAQFFIFLLPWQTAQTPKTYTMTSIALSFSHIPPTYLRISCL